MNAYAFDLAPLTGFDLMRYHEARMSEDITTQLVIINKYTGDHNVAWLPIIELPALIEAFETAIDDRVHPIGYDEVTLRRMLTRTGLVWSE
jgi:hypothetical protein